MVNRAKGVVTVARRRGVSYFRYLLGGVAWPRATYRLAWSPSAPAMLQGAFAAAGELAARKVDASDARRLGLLAADRSASRATDAGASEVERLMDRAHAAGMTGVARSFGTLVRTREGVLQFGDLSAARRHRLGSLHFLSARDRDRRAFNRRFGAALLTESGARQALRDAAAAVPPDYRDYAPFDFGGGLVIGRIASTDSGTGRWEYCNGPVVGPLVADQRVLDLGSNNGSLPLMMLRAGAREVLAIEANPAIADAARVNARILAWRDMRPYNLQVLTGDMRLFLAGDLGEFDVVTAFCSLYYVPEEDMARIIRKAASMNAVLVLQGNEAIDNLPARTLDLHRLIRDNGYADVALHTPAGFARPLLVAQTAVRVAMRHREAVARL